MTCFFVYNLETRYERLVIFGLIDAGERVSDLFFFFFLNILRDPNLPLNSYQAPSNARNYSRHFVNKI